MATTKRNPWDDDLAILSAENVNVAIETAGLGTRFGATLIDILIQAITFTIFAYFGALILDFLPLQDAGQWVRAFLVGIGIIMVMLLTLGYYFFFEWLWDGQTPGKRALKIRVLQTNGMPLTLWSAAVRNLLRVVDFLPILYGAGGFFAIGNPNNRRIGDLIAGTVVAREGRDPAHAVLDIDEVADAFLKSLHPPPGAPGADSVNSNGLPSNSAYEGGVTSGVDGSAAPTILGGRPDPGAPSPLDTHIGETERELLREFFIRRVSLKDGPRRALAHNLASRLAVRMGYAIPTAEESEAWLEGLIRASYASLPADD